MITTQDRYCSTRIHAQFIAHISYTWQENYRIRVIPFSCLAFQTNVHIASDWKTSSPQCYSWGTHQFWVPPAL